MILDRLGVFGDGASCIVNNGSTAIVGDEIDLKDDRKIAHGNPLYLILVVTTTFVGSGASAQFKLESDAVNPIVPASATENWVDAVRAITTLTAGTRLVFELPQGDYERYLGLTITGSGANITAGAVDAYISHEKPGWYAGQEGIS